MLIALCWCGVSLVASVVSADPDILLSSPNHLSEEVAESAPESTWTYSPSGQSVFLLRDEMEEGGPLVSIHHGFFPASSLDRSELDTDHRVNVTYRADVSSIGFLESRSLVDESRFGPHSGGYRQIVGYGLRLLDREALSFEIVPGFASDYSFHGPFEDRLNLMGNLNQNLSWTVTDSFVVSQNFNTTLERTEADDLSAVMNLDLETLFADRLSFKLSYEVHYDDSIGDALEMRDSRLSTSVGFRF